ncbi:MAG: peptidoglycan editing factor PgeF [Firmicutes bacterium]|nr:peptidoglycan editing factor PgeF [Bacillota bacterium]MDH7496434.1 peptidoglycan editing factor PgeF [Bacillota bacterium]
MEARRAGGVEYLVFPELEAIGAVSHAFTTRRGGTSEGPFATLNMAFHVGDDPHRVRKNRGLVLSALGAPEGGLVAGEQVHGEAVAVVGPEDRGRDWSPWSQGIPSTDCLVTASPGVVISCYVADCVPVFLADRSGRAIGLVHAGWRGIARRAPVRAVEALCAELHVSPRRLVAGIGPSIGPCCYEVGREVAEACESAAGTADIARPTGSQRFRLDLKEACRRELELAGLEPDSIVVAPHCTSCRFDLFFSHRAARGTTGRMAAIMFISE